MNAALAAACCARLAEAELVRLGSLRSRQDVRVLVEGGWLWVFWPAPDVDLARWLLSLPGVALFRHDEGRWRAIHRLLPIFNVPDTDQAQLLSSLLFPMPVQPLAPDDDWDPVHIRLLADETPRPTTAMRVSLGDLAQWAETATTRSLANMSVAWVDDRVVLRGGLPPLVGESFWGVRILVPTGWRAEPALPEPVLVKALALTTGEVALLTPTGADVLPEGAFHPLTRAGLRLARKEQPHAI
jgi:hypothetical protein